MNVKSTVAITLLLLSLSLFSGCGSASGEGEDATATDAQGSELNADVDADEEEYSVTVETTDGDTVTFSSKPLAAIMDAGILDIMDVLGHEDYIIGVSKTSRGGQSNLSDNLSKYLDDFYLDVSTIESEDGEEVDTYANLKNANPELILAGIQGGGNSESSDATMSDIAPTITFANDRNAVSSMIDSLEARVAAIVEIYGGDEIADEYFAEIYSKLETIREAVAGKSVVIITMDKNMLTTEQKEIGNTGTFMTADLGFTSLVDLTMQERTEETEQQTGENAEQEAESEQQEERAAREELSGQTVKDLNPDYIFILREEERQTQVSDDSAAETDTTTLTLEEKIDALGLGVCDAYKNGNFYYLESSVWRQNSNGFTSIIAMLDNMLEVLGLE